MHNFDFIHNILNLFIPNLVEYREYIFFENQDTFSFLKYIKVHRDKVVKTGTAGKVEELMSHSK